MTDEARLEILQISIDFEHRWVVSREGRGGGLVLYWKSSINLTIIGSDKNFIDAIIDKDSENEFRLTGFYGEPEIARRIEVWNKLRDLNSQPHIPCFCFGDFNEIIRQDEKLGAAKRPHNQMHLLEML